MDRPENSYPELIHYLRRYTTLDTLEISQIAACIEPVKLQRGEWLLHPGEQCEHLYYVRKGMIRTVAEGSKSEITAWVTLPLRFVTATYSYIKHKPSIVGLQAIARSELLRIAKADVKQLYQSIPALKDVSLAIMNEHYIDLERLYIFCLSHSARQRYANLYSYFPDLFFKVPLKYLASMIHVKPETLSRIRKLVDWTDGELSTGTE
jgi:CRP-like cAMP-binding protein